MDFDASGFGAVFASFAAGFALCYFVLSKAGKLVKKAPKDAPQAPPNSGPRGSGNQIP